MLFSVVKRGQMREGEAERSTSYRRGRGQNFGLEATGICDTFNTFAGRLLSQSCSQKRRRELKALLQTVDQIIHWPHAFVVRH